VVAEFAFGTPAATILDMLLTMAKTGEAARKQQAVRAMVDAFVFRRDELHPDALSWALATLVWRKQAGIRQEQLNSTVLAPWELMWPEWLCRTTSKYPSQMVYACRT
jgi:hypothetical protein